MADGPQARSLLIEATFLRVEGETCDRCGDTSASVRAAADALEKGLAPLNIPVTLIEHDATAENLPDSNTILINGRSLEDLLGAERVATDCPSCSDLVGESVCCSAVSMDGAIHESLTADHVMRAALIAIGMLEAPGGLHA